MTFKLFIKFIDGSKVSQNGMTMPQVELAMSKIVSGDAVELRVQKES